MKVSILTPTRNNVATIGQTINSVLMQDYQNIEYILVDGNSDDGSKEVIESFSSKISKVIYKRSYSPCEALNFCLHQATGDIVGSVNGDDFFIDRKIISKIVECFRDNSIECVYGDMIYVDRINTNKIIRYWKSSTYKEGSFNLGWHPTWAAIFFRKEVFEKYGYLNTDLKIACDYEFLLRTIHKNKIKIKYLPEVFTHMRSGGYSNSKLKNLINANIESGLAWKINNLKMPRLFFFVKPISKIYQYLIKS